MLALLVICRYSYPMSNTNKTPNIATLIRDGYLTEDEADDIRLIERAKMQWMDDYSAYQLDQLLLCDDY